jgi:Tol biopolymer transport system component
VPTSPSRATRNHESGGAAGDGRIALLKYVVYHAADRIAMLVPLQPRGSAAPLLPDLKGQVSDVDLSPDGRWIAFESNESNRFEIYIRASSW